MKLKNIIGSTAAKWAACLLAIVCIGGAWGAAQIGDTPYATLAEAVAAVPTDGTMTTITMTADEDSSSNVTIPEGVSITLDGGADPGYQVGTIVNNGTLSLKGYVIATKIVNNSTARQFGYDSYVTCDMENSEGATFTAGYGQAASHATITGNIVNRGTFTANQAYFDIIGNVVNHGTLTFTASGGSISSGVVNFGTFTFGKCNNNTTISGGIVNYGNLTVLEPSSKNHTKIINGGIGNYGHAEITTTTTKTTTINGTITVGAGAYLKITGPINAYTVSALVEPTTTWAYDSVGTENFRITEYDDTGVVVNYVAQSPYGRYETFKAAWDDVMAHNVGNSIELLADATLNEILSDSAFTCSGGLHLSLNGHTLTVNANGGFSFANDWWISSSSTAGKIVINGDNLAERFSIGENGKLTIVKGKVDAELGSETSLLDVLEIVYASGYAITEDSTNIYVQRASDVPAVVHVDSIALDKTEMTLAIGETNTLTATIAPANATEQFVVWSAGDINIAGIETPVLAADIATIKVFGQSAGTAYISARPLDWGEENPENYVCCTVTVTRSSNFYQDANDEDILHIANLAGLQEFRNEVNAGNSFAGKTVVLDVDIDMSSIASWDPIGQDYETIQGGDKLERRFAGTFDGNNKTLSNLTINDNTHNEAGLFGVTGYGSTFRDLTLDSPTVNGRVGVGTLAGKLWASSVINCHVTGDITVTGYQCVGGLAGSDSYTDITGCSVIGDDKATSVITGNYVAGIEDGDNIGGLVGMNGPSDPAAQKADQATSNCSVGNLTLRGWRKVGGLSGQSYNRESVYDCSVGDIDIICLADTTFAAAKEETLAFGGMVGIFAVLSDDTKYRHAENSYLEGTVSNVTITCANDDVNAYAKMGIISGGQRGSTDFVVPTDTQFNVTVSGTNSTSGTKVSDNTDKIYSAYKPPVAQIGDEKYATLAEAIADAQGGDTILLLADATLDAAVTVSKSLTITLDGHSITGTITAGAGYELVTSDTAYVVRGAGYAGEVLPAGPDMSGDVINVTAANAQYTLDGAYGDITGKTINFTENITERLDLGRCTKYAGSGTTTSGTYPNHTRTLSNVTFTSSEGVTIAGFTANSGHVCSNGDYDYVRDQAVTSTNNGYYKYSSLTGITFEGLTVSDNIFAKYGLEGTICGNITFDGCTFTGNTSDTAPINFNNDGSFQYGDITIQNCTINGSKAGIYINGGAAEYTIKNNYVVAGNNNAIQLWAVVGSDATVDIEGNFLKSDKYTVNLYRFESEQITFTGNAVVAGARGHLGHFQGDASGNFWAPQGATPDASGNMTSTLTEPIADTSAVPGENDITSSSYYSSAVVDTSAVQWVTLSNHHTFVAQIGDDKYETLAEAIAAADTASVDEITILDDSITTSPDPAWYIYGTTLKRDTGRDLWYVAGAKETTYGTYAEALNAANNDATKVFCLWSGYSKTVAEAIAAGSLVIEKHDRYEIEGYTGDTAGFVHVKDARGLASLAGFKNYCDTNCRPGPVEGKDHLDAFYWTDYWTVVLDCNIDLDNKAWTAVNTGMPSKVDGNGKTILNVSVNIASGAAGLFTECGLVSNLKVDGANISAGTGTAGTVVALQRGGGVENVAVSNAVVIGKYVGGIVGSTYGDTFTGNIVGNVSVTTSVKYVGGIAGQFYMDGNTQKVEIKNNVLDDVRIVYSDPNEIYGSVLGALIHGSREYVVTDNAANNITTNGTLAVRIGNDTSDSYNAIWAPRRPDDTTHELNPNVTYVNNVLTPMGKMVTFELDGTAPTGATAPSDGAYAVDSTLPLPTYESDDTTFAGWKVKNSDPAVIITVLPAGTTGDITLVATWTGAKTIKINAGGTEPTTIKVTDEWLAEHKLTGASEETIKAALEDNTSGTPVWQSYVLGQDVDAAVTSDAEQGETTLMPVTSTIDVPAADTGFDVQYRLDVVDEDGKLITAGTPQDTPDLAVELSDISGSAYYKLTAVVTAKDESGASVTVPADNTIGVLKVESGAKTTAIAVPWEALGGGDISVSNIVRTATLTPGDELKAYDKTTDKYKVWTLSADKTWEPNLTATSESTTLADGADLYTVKRGSAVWLTRQDTTQPIYLVGEVAATEKAEVKLEAGTTTNPSWNLVGSAGTEPVNVNEIGAATTDKIIVPTATIPKNYEYNTEKGEWGYWDYETVVKPNGRKTVTKVWKTAEDIPAGTGFWYLNGGYSKDINL